MAVELKWPILGIIIPSFLIAFIQCTYHYFILAKHETLKTQVIFEIFAALLWLSYLLAIITDPGSVPDDYKPGPTEWRRWCNKCKKYKPERSHHCKVCKKCVLKMDHHCPWTYNCVGHNNMPHFIRFLLYIDTLSLYVLISVVKNACRFYRMRSLPAYLISKSELTATIILIPVDGFVFLSVLLLTIRVFASTIFSGMTQIETWEQERIESQMRHNHLQKSISSEYLKPYLEFYKKDTISRDDIGFPYDISLYHNLITSWGPLWSLFLPFGHACGDGIHFEKNEYGSCEGEPCLPWPPDHENQDPPSDADTLSNSTKDSEKKPEVPHWRRGITSEASFFKRQRWQNFEGESINDFGVDPESEE